MARPIKDETGNRYGDLFVLSRAGSDKWRKVTWRCLCDCGKVTVVYGGNLRRGLVSSCGHTQDRSCQITHGHTVRNASGKKRTATYETWRAMRARCYNPNDNAFRYYGARGIGVCVRWHISTPNAFQNFLSGMGERPTGKTLDRIKSNYGYMPSNCRWATSKEQAESKRLQKIGAC